jgi:hypothetical protein
VGSLGWLSLAEVFDVVSISVQQEAGLSAAVPLSVVGMGQETMVCLPNLYAAGNAASIPGLFFILVFISSSAVQ